MCSGCPYVSGENSEVEVMKLEVEIIGRSLRPLFLGRSWQRWASQRCAVTRARKLRMQLVLARTLVSQGSFRLRFSVNLLKAMGTASPIDGCFYHDL